MNSRTIQYLSISLFVLLLLWGGYTLFIYLGVPYHGAALMSDESITAVSQSCDAGAYFCRGLATLIPFVWNTISRASPMLWYAVLSLLVFGAFAGWQVVATGQWMLRIRWTPWKLLLLSIGCLWLMSTVLSFGSVKGTPVRLYVEPTKENYAVSDQALATLQSEYRVMLDRGCLAIQGQMPSGAILYSLRTWCIQEAFVTRVLTQVLFVLVLLCEFLVLGRMLLREILLRRRAAAAHSGCPSLMTEALLSAGLGACGWIVLLWLLAVTGLYTATAGWILAVMVPVIGYRHAQFWIDRFLRHSWEEQYRPWDVSLLLGWLLIGYIAINFLEVVRPFPIGWDDLGSYLNRPRLLVSYGTFIASMSPFDWTYLTSLGFLLFGYNAHFGSTASMMVNWSAGLLAVLGVLIFVRTFLGKKTGTLSALLYYSLPLVGHFSFADMKIDNAIFFFSTAGMLALLLALAPPSEDATHETASSHPGAVRWIFLSGVFLGFAFSTKVTAIMGIFALGAMFMGMSLRLPAFIGAAILGFAVFAKQQTFSVDNIFMRITGTPAGEHTNTYFILFCVLVGGACIAYSVMRKRSAWRSIVRLSVAFAAGITVAVLPWIAHNNIEAGNIVPRLVLSAPNTLSPVIDLESLPPELAVNTGSPLCKPSGAREELDRYWGFTQGWSHYLTLPWRTVMNLDSTGYYVTTFPALLLFPLVLLLPFFWTGRGRWLRWLTLGTAFMLVEWIFLANGIPWYGVGMLLGIVVGLETLIVRAPDLPNRIIAIILITFSLFSAFGMRFWQLEQQRNILEYSMGKISADALREITIPWYDAISATVIDRHLSMPDRPYLYRVGTFIAYFIPRNLEVIGLSDHQLDFFNCLYQERDPQLTVKRLKALGFNSIIFDTNTATIEKDEQGSLHTKVNAFVEFANNPASKVQIVVSDSGAGVAYILIP